MTNIVILSGTHGNELGPTYEIERLFKNDIIKSKLLPGNYFIYSRLNNTKNRNDENNVNINRQWFDGTSYYKNRQMLPIINNSNIIIDFHEAHNFYSTDKKSLGNTIYTNNSLLYKKIKFKIIPILNKYITQSNKKWVLLNNLHYIKLQIVVKVYDDNKHHLLSFLSIIIFS